MGRGLQSNRLRRQRSSVVYCVLNDECLLKSRNICEIDAECCAIVIVRRYGGAIFVVQTRLWCDTGVVSGAYLVKSGVYLTLPLVFTPQLSF